MKKTCIKTLICGFAAAVALAFAGQISPASAASSGMSISPMSQKIVLAPGDVYTGSIKVYNSSSNGAELTYKAIPDSFFVDDSYVVTIGTRNDYTAIKDWVTLKNATGTLKSGESAEIIYTIKVPNDAVAGGQYASIVVSNVPPSGEEGAIGIQEVWQIASTIYASIAGSSTLSGNIKTNAIPSIVLNPPLEASFTVENTGNVHTNATSYLQVFPIFSDEEVYTNEEKPDTSIVLPGTSRFVTSTWSEAPAVGIFRVRQTISAFGAESVNEKVVIFCPLWLMLIVLILVAGCIYWLVSRAIRRKNTRRSSEE